MTPRIGNVLPNGAIVIEIKGRVILAKNNCGTRDEYVTWRWNGTDPQSTVFGRYREKLSEAAIDFEERVQADRPPLDEMDVERISDKWRTR